MSGARSSRPLGYAARLAWRYTWQTAAYAAGIVAALLVGIAAVWLAGLAWLFIEHLLRGGG